MTTDVRADLKQVEGLIGRLLSIGHEFQNKDRDWSHYRNKEDWERNVYKIEYGRKRATLEQIYSDGRDMALFMSDALLSINYDITTYPTLSSIIERFEGTWIDSDLNHVVDEATQVYDEFGLNCWAFQQMVSTFRDQQKLAKIVKSTLNLLMETDLYKLENGMPVNKEKSSVTINNVSGSNISVGSENVNQNIEGTDAIFADLIAAIDEADIEEKEALKETVVEMQEARGSSGFSDAYKKFVAASANHMAVIGPFIPALSGLL
ncbi:hypothetical protein DES49_0532 [Halospina denitrificans]|uniref:AbiTii domain-containing protein n=1 Tax=Halospina denitrificans TaxID=332522 RepID=A0A4R7K0S1_9GAMM|nr:hypothetical protein [Halospina denitrificans]TDT44430.1 hypothetical protein DES49_0532 [Halospina denitrificans]